MINDLWYKNAVIYASPSAPTWTQRRRRRRFQGTAAPARLSAGARRHRDLADAVSALARHATTATTLPITTVSIPATARWAISSSSRTAAEQRGIRVIIDSSSTTPPISIRGFKQARKDPEVTVPRMVRLVRQRARAAPTRAWCFPACRSRRGRYDKEAKAWYFHRFYDFQPDLNTSNPRCRPRSSRSWASGCSSACPAFAWMRCRS